MLRRSLYRKLSKKRARKNQPESRYVKPGDYEHMLKTKTI